MVNPFLSRVKSGLVIRSGEYRVIGSVLNTSVRLRPRQGLEGSDIHNPTLLVDFSIIDKTEEQIMQHLK